MALGKPDLDRFLFEEYKYSTADLGIYRILYATCILIVYLPQFLWIPNFPDSFFNPPFGITLFFPGFPSASFFYILNVFLTWAACALLVGYRTRLASISLAGLLLIGNSWGYSFGKITQEIPLVLIPLVLQFTGWGESFSLDAGRTKPVHPSYNRWPLALLALLIGFAMLTAAVAKASTGWLDVKSHAVLGHILRHGFVEGGFNRVTAQVSRVKWGGVWEFSDYATVLLEGSFIFAAVRSRAFRIVCALACFFHLGISIIMEISVWSNVLAYGAFFHWSILESRASGRKALRAWMTFLTRMSVWKLFLSSTALSLIYLTFDKSIRDSPIRNLAGPTLIWVAAILAGVFLIGQIRSAVVGSSTSIQAQPPIILFDGYCGLCNGWVDFVLKHDHRMVYRLTPLQSQAGQDLLKRLQMPTGFDESLVLVDGDQVYPSSSGVIRILRGLGMPFSLASIFLLVPQVFRDRIYKIVADRRLQWFGRTEVCRVPTPDERNRFL